VSKNSSERATASPSQGSVDRWWKALWATFWWALAATLVTGLWLLERVTYTIDQSVRSAEEATALPRTLVLISAAVWVGSSFALVAFYFLFQRRRS